jgi:branched-chain amino acid transport system permease protein
VVTAELMSPPEEREHGRLTHNARWAIAFTVLGIVVFVGYHWIYPNMNNNVQTFIDSWMPLSVVDEMMVWTICALGLNIVVGFAGLLDLGYVAFWALGGYTCGYLFSGGPSSFFGLHINIFGSAPKGAPGIHINFILVLFAAAIVTAVFGILIGAPTLRLKSDYLALVTLGFGEIIPQFFANGDHLGSLTSDGGFNLTNGDLGITPVDHIKIGPWTIGTFDLDWQFLVFACLAAFVVFVCLRLRVGRLGRAWLAIREDELAASMMGVPLMRTKLSAYAVGAVAGGIGGVAFATHVGGVLPGSFSFAISITLLAMVVLGGMGNVWGVMIGALVLSWVNSNGLKQIGSTVNSAFGTSIDFPSYNYLMFGLILVLMMLFRREGFLPESRTKLLLREPGRTEMEAVGSDLEGIGLEGVDS